MSKRYGRNRRRRDREMVAAFTAEVDANTDAVFAWREARLAGSDAPLSDYLPESGVVL